MYQSDSVLKMYADSGLRTVEHWVTLGRDITAGAKPRVDAAHRGLLVSLYSRDQTRLRSVSTRKGN